MIERAVHDARQLLAGPAIQVRCLECPGIAPVPRAGRGGASESLWARLIALVWQG
jgi:protease-4